MFVSLFSGFSAANFLVDIVASSQGFRCVYVFTCDLVRVLIPVAPDDTRLVPLLVACPCLLLALVGLQRNERSQRRRT